MANRLLFSSIALVCVVAIGCSGLNSIWGREIKPDYCGDHPGDPDCPPLPPPDAAIDAAIDAPDYTCKSNATCTAPTGVCDLAGSRMCVQCVAPDQTSACLGTTPVCGTTHECERCTKHTDCPLSNLCLLDGACAAPADVAYVQQGGAGNLCTLAAPCGTLDAGIKTNRPLVKIGVGIVADNKTTTIDGKVVAIFADLGAKLDMVGNGVILEVKSNGADVSIYDLEITGATGTNTDAAISLPNGGAPKLALTRVSVDGNQGIGISSNGGTLTVTESQISGNQGGGISLVGGSLALSRSDVALNFGGGISATGVGVSFDITNNFIYRNGDPDGGTFGGLTLGIAGAGSNRLEFNTIVDNRSAINSAGVVCNATAFAAPNNIIARNVLGASSTAPGAQVTPSGCTFPTSKIQSDVLGLGFVDPEAPAPFDYRITSTSTVINQALTASTIVIDRDGDVRPIGVQKDIGADEFKP